MFSPDVGHIVLNEICTEHHNNISLSFMSTPLPGSSSDDFEQCKNHGGYPENRNVRYASHNMADAQRDKNRHVYFSIKTASNKMILVHSFQCGHSYCDATSKQITPGRNALLLMTKKSTCGPYRTVCPRGREP